MSEPGAGCGSTFSSRTYVSRSLEKEEIKGRTSGLGHRTSEDHSSSRPDKTPGSGPCRGKCSGTPVAVGKRRVPHWSSVTVIHLREQVLASPRSWCVPRFTPVPPVVGPTPTPDPRPCVGPSAVLCRSGLRRRLWWTRDSTVTLSCVGPRLGSVVTEPYLGSRPSTSLHPAPGPSRVLPTRRHWRSFLSSPAHLRSSFWAGPRVRRSYYYPLCSPPA